MKDLEGLHWLLNLKIECDRVNKTVSFSQEAYTVGNKTVRMFESFELSIEYIF